MAKPPKDANAKDKTPKPDIVVAAKAPMLDATQQKIVREILDAAETVRNETEALLRSFGRLVLTRVLDGNTTSAQAIETSKNPVIRELMRRAGGPTLRINPKLFSECVRIAGWEQAINDETYRGLDFDRKTLLLPLADGDRIREAAQHVAAFKLDLDATEAYVASLRKKSGKPPLARLSPRRAKTVLAGTTKRLTDKRGVERLLAACEDLPPEERKALDDEVEKLVETLLRIRSGLKRK